MAGLMSVKTKRKDLDEGYDEFSEFSLNSPARKIRRLDAELPPIMEEEDTIVTVEQQMPPGLVSSPVPELGSAMVDAEPPFPLNQERALVLYKPVDHHFVLSSPDVSFTVHSDLVSNLKNQAFWSANANAVIVEEVPMDYKQAAANNSLAVVPWIPSRGPSAAACESRITHVEEPMEAEEEVGSASMEVEEDTQQAGAGVAGEDLHQWPQHCLIPQPRENTTTPITWSWG